MVCVDGQQRLTTTSLLVAAVADMLHDIWKNTHLKTKEDIQIVESALMQCEYCLYKDKNALLESLNNQDLVSSMLNLRLLPSDTDRGPFLKCLLGNRIDSNKVIQYEEESQIIKAKTYFDTSLQLVLSQTETQHRLKLLWKILQSSVIWMRMMKVTVESDVDLCQWFLWLQEKTLMGFASLLANDAPGVDFQAGVLIKNLLLSVFLEKSVEVQDNIYRQMWPVSLQQQLESNTFIGEEILQSFYVDYITYFQKAF